MTFSHKTYRFIGRSYESIGAFVLLSISSVMFIDVVGRYFGRPIKGSFDIVEAFMALGAFWFLPLLSYKDQHISVTIFKANGGTIATLQALFIEAFCAAISLLMAWCLFSIANEFEEYQEVSLILGLPKAPFVQACAVIVIIMTAVHFYKLIQTLRTKEARS